MKRGFDKKYILIIAPLITAIWLLAIYYFKGIYPFGTGTIIDCDLYQGGIPIYDYVRDAWHGGSLFYDFTTACGAGRDVTLALLDPNKLFLTFFRRDMIPNAVCILLIIKFCVVSFTASFSFLKLFERLSPTWLCAVSLMYTFSGFNIEYFTNLDWLDVVALYPLILLFIKRMFDNKSKIPYYLALTYLLTVFTYLSFFVIVSIIVFVGLYIFIIEDKNKRKEDIFSLGAGTLGALVTSSYSIYRYYRLISTTARFGFTKSIFNNEAEVLNAGQGSFEFIPDYLKLGPQVDIVKLMMYFGMELAVACLILIIIRAIREKPLRKYASFFAISFLLLICQTFILGVDMFWHFGSYVMFPMRNGYMIAMLGCLLISYYYNNIDCKDGIRIKNNIAKITFALVTCFASVILIVPRIKVFYKMIPAGFDVLTQEITLLKSMIYPFSTLFLFGVIGFIILKAIDNKHIRSLATLTILTVYFSTMSFALIGNAENSAKAKEYNSYYENAFEVGNIYKKNDVFSRVNNPDVSLITNYPYIAKIPSISNWTYMLSQSQIDAFIAFGFSNAYTRVIDSGATAFSKSLLRVTDTVSKDELNDDLYLPINNRQGNFNCYRNKYILPVGIVFNNNICNIAPKDYENTFEYQNEIYSCFGKNDELFEELAPESINTSNDVKDVKVFGENVEKTEIVRVNANYEISNKKAIYLSCKNKNVSIDNIAINGEVLKIPDLPDYEGMTDRNVSSFPSVFNNNVLELGTFENCKVEITITFNKGDFSDLNIYGLNLEKLEELCLEKSENEYSVNKDKVCLNVTVDDSDSIVFIPISYDERWKCTLNGEKTEVLCIMGDFIGVRAQQGNNEIFLEYSHKEDILNIVCLIPLFFIGLGIVILLGKKQRIIPRSCFKLLSCVFVILFCIAMIVLYIIPTLSSLIFALIK